MYQYIYFYEYQGKIVASYLPESLFLEEHPDAKYLCQKIIGWLEE